MHRDPANLFDDGNVALHEVEHGGVGVEVAAIREPARQILALNVRGLPQVQLHQIVRLLGMLTHCALCVQSINK